MSEAFMAKQSDGSDLDICLDWIMRLNRGIF